MDGTEVEVGGACHDARKVEPDIKSLAKNALGDFTRYLNPYTLVTTKGTYEGQRRHQRQARLHPHPFCLDRPAALWSSPVVGRHDG
jgi:hypothetical protein